MKKVARGKGSGSVTVVAGVMAILLLGFSGASFAYGDADAEGGEMPLHEWTQETVGRTASLAINLVGCSPIIIAVATTAKIMSDQVEPIASVAHALHNSSKN